MIFVTVGTQKFQFDRLFETIDSMVDEGKIEDKIFAQVGCSSYKPKNFDYVDFINKSDFDTCVKECDLLLTHSGVATIMLGLKYHKPIVVVPRLKAYGEHVDDHQMQIAETFSQKNYIVMCGEKDALDECIRFAKQQHFEEYVSQRELAVKTIKEYISMNEKE